MRDHGVYVISAARAEVDRRLRAVEAHYRRDLVPVRTGPLVPLAGDRIKIS